MMMLSEIMDRVQAGMTKEEAAALLASQVEEIVGLGDSNREEATRLVLTNIGYFAGYYAPEIADRAYELFNTEHPIFGRTHPTPEEAFRLGMEYSKRRGAKLN